MSRPSDESIAAPQRGPAIDLQRHRRRRSLSEATVQFEISTLRTWFFTPGATGRCLYLIVRYVLVTCERKRLNGSFPLAQRLALESIRAWVFEPISTPAERRARLEIIAHCSHFCGRYGVTPRWSNNALAGFTDGFAPASTGRQHQSELHHFILSLAKILEEADAYARTQPKKENPTVPPTEDRTGHHQPTLF